MNSRFNEVRTVILPIGVEVDGVPVTMAIVQSLSLMDAMRAENLAEVVPTGVDKSSWRNICRLAARVSINLCPLSPHDLLKFHELDADALWTAAKEVEVAEAAFRTVAQGDDGGSAGVSRPT